MELHPSARKYYTVRINVTPPVAGTWEASFDGGTNWVAGFRDLDDPSIWRWLLAGPTGPVIANTTVITKSVDPLLRVMDDAEVEVLDGPPIFLTIPDRYPSA